MYNIHSSKNVLRNKGACTKYMFYVSGTLKGACTQKYVYYKMTAVADCNRSLEGTLHKTDNSKDIIF